MAKKAKKVSWRTIARRAEKAADLPKARRLRAESAALRRADRAAKRKTKKKAVPGARRGFAVRATKRALAALAEQAPNQQHGINRAPSEEAWQATKTAMDGEMRPDRGAPGHGEVVGGVFAEIAERIAKLARKKNGMNGVYAELSSLALTKHYEGCVETDKSATTRLVEVQQIMADRIVCGFLAEMEHTMNFHRGFPPGMVHVIDEFTITKIIDALNAAGYSARGKNSTHTENAKAIGR